MSTPHMMMTNENNMRIFFLVKRFKRKLPFCQFHVVLCHCFKKKQHQWCLRVGYAHWPFLRTHSLWSLIFPILSGKTHTCGKFIFSSLLFHLHKGHNGALSGIWYITTTTFNQMNWSKMKMVYSITDAQNCLCNWEKLLWICFCDSYEDWLVYCDLCTCTEKNNMSNKY